MFFRWFWTKIWFFQKFGQIFDNLCCFGPMPPTCLLSFCGQDAFVVKHHQHVCYHFCFHSWSWLSHQSNNILCYNLLEFRFLASSEAVVLLGASLFLSRSLGVSTPLVQRAEFRISSGRPHNPRLVQKSRDLKSLGRLGGVQGRGGGHNLWLFKNQRWALVLPCTCRVLCTEDRCRRGLYLASSRVLFFSLSLSLYSENTWTLLMVFDWESQCPTECRLNVGQWSRVEGHATCPTHNHTKSHITTHNHT